MLHKYNSKSIWYLDRSRMQNNSFFDRLIALYFRKRSEIETWEGGIVYRKRIFRWFGILPYCFIYYYFHSINEIDDDADQCYWISGRISAVYLLADGQTVHHTENLKNVSLPKFFSDMSEIRKALESLRDY